MVKIISILIIGSIYALIMLLPREIFYEVPGGDNAGHICISFILTIIGLNILSNKKLLLNLIIIFIFLSLVELLQLFSARNYALTDLIFNFIGFVIAIFVFKVFKFLKIKLLS